MTDSGNNDGTWPLLHEEQRARLAGAYGSAEEAEQARRAIESALPGDAAARLLAAAADSPSPKLALDRACDLFPPEDPPPPPPDDASAKALACLLAGSSYLTSLLGRNTDWLPWLYEHGGNPFGNGELRRDLASVALPGVDSLRSNSFADLRHWHQKHLVRIGWADLGGLRDIAESAAGLAALADVVVDTVAELYASLMQERFGRPVQEDGSPARWCIIGLGKLGGSELNFRSDVDVIFVYSADGESEGGSRGSVSVHEWFTRWAERTVTALTDVTPSGMFYRVDTRLRPDGSAGALARSLASYEHYYETRGEVWERQMLIKARGIAGDLSLAETFTEMLRPFVFPATLTRSPRDEIRSVKNRILRHLAARDAATGSQASESNLKLRRGGLRDIEFIAQCLQMVVGGADREVRSANTLTAVAQLSRRRVLSDEEAAALTEAYRFYRRIEHRLQMAAGQATFALPDDREARRLLARQVGSADEAALLDTLARHRAAVTAIYDDVLGPPESPDDVALLLELAPGAEEAASPLEPYGFRDTAAAHRHLRLLAYGNDEAQPLAAPRSAVVRLVPSLLEQLRTSVDPDKGLTNLEHVLDTFGAVESFADLLAGHAGFLELLVTLCASSQAFSDILLRDPALIDWMVSGSALGRKRTPEEIELVLRAALAGLDERRVQREIHTFRKRETMRVGLLYLLKLADADETAQQLTAIADAIIRRAYRTVMDELFEQRGVPLDSDGAPVSMAIVAVGKLGSGEMNFGSDLDIFFVYEADGETTKGRDNVTFFTTAAQAIVRQLTDPTRFGTLYEVDTRLRPEGKSGPLALSLSGYRNYLHGRASTWERQALTRAYVITPSSEPGRYVPLPRSLHERARAFSAELMGAVYDFVYSPAEASLVDEMAEMRQRMEDEAARKYEGRANIKTGAGGLVDGEFIAQLGQLIHGREDDALRGKGTIPILERLSETGKLPLEVAGPLAEGYATLLNLQMMLRIDDEHSHNVIPEDPERQRTLARSLGLASALSLHDNLNAVRASTRAAYLAGLEIFRNSL